jgi:hypothetical protein
MSGRSVDETLYCLRSVAGRADDKWASGFAMSILKQARRPSWQPSAKQLALMGRLVDEMFVPDLDLFEGGGDEA